VIALDGSKVGSWFSGKVVSFIFEENGKPKQNEASGCV
jgi:hypothetical protein